MHASESKDGDSPSDAQAKSTVGARHESVANREVVAAEWRAIALRGRSVDNSLVGKALVTGVLSVRVPGLQLSAGLLVDLDPGGQRLHRRLVFEATSSIGIDGDGEGQLNAEQAKQSVRTCHGRAADRERVATCRRAIARRWWSVVNRLGGLSWSTLSVLIGARVAGALQVDRARFA